LGDEIIISHDDKASILPIYINPKNKTNKEQKFFDKMNTIFLIHKTNNKEVKIINDVEIEKIVKMMVLNNKIEMMKLPFHKYLMAYNYILPNNNLTTHWQNLENNLYKFLSSHHISYKIIEIPFKDSEIYKRVLSLIELN